MGLSKSVIVASTMAVAAASLAFSLMRAEGESNERETVAAATIALPVEPMQVAPAAAERPVAEVSSDSERPTAAGPSDDADESLTEEEILEARREVIRQYFAARRAKLDIVATTHTSSGQEFDWIPREAVDEAGNPVTPPPGPGDETDAQFEHLEVGDYVAQTELQQEPDAWGPEGTVPVVRMDTDEYIASIRPQGTLRDFLSKYGHQDIRPGPADSRTPEHGDPPVPGVIHPDRQYAMAQHNEANTGTMGSINIWQPFVEKDYEFSLGQTAVSAQTEAVPVCIGGPLGATNFFCITFPRVQQTVEAGWQVTPGDWFASPNRTHFFIYFTTNGYTYAGDNQGGHAHRVDGFVQYSRSVTPGARIGGISTLGGAQYTLPLVVRLYRGNWWIRYGNEWVGYFPASLFGGWRVGGLATRGERVSWYGEVVDLEEKDEWGNADADQDPTATDMGSGRFPEEGYGYAAYMRNLLVRRAFDGAIVPFDPDHKGRLGVDVPCYGLEPHFHDPDPEFGSHFYWGGGGRNATTCN